ncbi:hypothetical protein [Parapedobacter sp. 10938]|uniref:hypothetical protein n=1 Tax=Parapedobacter flavus TaxID=3110225 RepID=UPI002DB86074|nr:hypothetical protein [Parapedobacter sp. 10938]MEC3878661.1 hypothetical protein [Parapedobacter sp. 10938]
MKEKHTYHHVDVSGKLPEVWRANPYTVPNGYFENLHLRTIQTCKNADIPPKAFGIPDGYFEQLADSITAKIAEQALKATVNESGFVVPDNYFSASEQQLGAICKINERVTDTGFTVPERYFYALPHRIKRKTYQVAPPVRTLRRPKWVAYAAAASIALVLGLIGMFRIAQNTSETKSPLASVPDEQIVDYLELYGPPNDMIYISEQLDDFDVQSIGEGISDEDIEAYLNHTL